jgi:hypothetical protein
MVPAAAGTADAFALAPALVGVLAVLVVVVAAVGDNYGADVVVGDNCGKTVLVLVAAVADCSPAVVAIRPVAGCTIAGDYTGSYVVVAD